MYVQQLAQQCHNNHYCIIVSFACRVPSCCEMEKQNTKYYEYTAILVIIAKEQKKKKKKKKKISAHGLPTRSPRAVLSMLAQA